MSQRQLERYQVWLYLAAIVAGLAVGATTPEAASVLDRLLWPILAVLLYVTFTQVPMTRIATAFRDGRFMAAQLLGNFVLVPLVLWGLLLLVPDDPAIRLGVLLVLLVPCTDWFVTFAHLGGADTHRAIAATPINLLVQLALLPIYLWLFLGNALLELLDARRIAGVFVSLIVLPLLAAWLTERLAERSPRCGGLVARLGWLPVPLLAVVVFLIAAAQIQAVLGALPLLGQLTGVFLAYLLLAAALGVALGRAFALPVGATRTLVFSLGTRNSFVVLPLALALPVSWAVAAVVIVLQSLVELLGMVAYLWAVPRVVAGPRGPAAAAVPVRR
jgi:ACR3 family arsenite efflux pump ArsB